MHPADRLRAPAADAMHAIERMSDFMFAIVTGKGALVFKKIVITMESWEKEDEGNIV
jgi:hypothetical protein